MDFKEFIESGRKQQSVIEGYMKYIRFFIGVAVAIGVGFYMYQSKVLELPYIIAIVVVGILSVSIDLIPFGKKRNQGDAKQEYVKQQIQKESSSDEIDKMLAKQRAKRRLNK